VLVAGMRSSRLMNLAATQPEKFGAGAVCFRATVA
jgi:hypothetical protein